jgi:hypothetical protein
MYIMWVEILATQIPTRPLRDETTCHHHFATHIQSLTGLGRSSCLLPFYLYSIPNGIRKIFVPQAHYVGRNHRNADSLPSLTEAKPLAIVILLPIFNP